MKNFWTNPDVVDEFTKALGEHLNKTTKFWYQGKADSIILHVFEYNESVTYIVPVIKYKYDNRDIIENWDDLWDENSWKEDLFSFHKGHRTSYAYLRQEDSVSEPSLGYFYGMVKIKEYVNDGNTRSLVIMPSNHSKHTRLRSCYASAHRDGTKVSS